jgi:hypothetical protein
MYRANRLQNRRRFITLEILENRQLLSGEPWTPAARMMGQDLAVAHYPQLTGAGESIAIIDSGVDYRHPSLGGGFGSAFKVEAGYDFIKNDGDPMSDSFAHGTGSAGVIASSHYVYNGYQDQGVAPGVHIIALREDSTAGVKSALDWVLANRTKYNIVGVNLVDFGGTSGAYYQSVLQTLAAAGVFIAHPAGNSGATANMRPKLDSADFGIGSVNYHTGQMSDFSQRGPYLDLVAPGEKVTLPYYDVATKKHIFVDTADGTSWASPAVVATAALIKQIDSRFTPAQMMKIMQDSGVTTYDPISRRTYKRLNIDAALALAYKQRGGTPVPPASSGPVVVPPPPTAAQTPYKGSLFATNQVIQAEDFDNGGEGVAFHDLDSINIGGSAYRGNSGVDIQDMNGGKFVGFTCSAEFLEYTINVAAAGTYDFAARVASFKPGGTFHVEVDGVNVTGTMTVPNTGGWQNWQTITKTTRSLPAGKHTVRIKMDADGRLGYVGNFDCFKFTPAGVSSPAAVAASPARNAFTTISATTATTFKGVTPQGTSMVNSLDNGDWELFHSVDFGTGANAFTASVAAITGGKKIQIRLDSPTGAVIGNLTIASTRGLTTFKTQRTGIRKVTGIHNLYLTFTGGAPANLQSFRFS